VKFWSIKICYLCNSWDRQCGSPNQVSMSLTSTSHIPMMWAETGTCRKTADSASRSCTSGESCEQWSRMRKCKRQKIGPNWKEIDRINREEKKKMLETMIAGNGLSGSPARIMQVSSSAQAVTKGYVDEQVNRAPDPLSRHLAGIDRAINP